MPALCVGIKVSASVDAVARSAAETLSGRRIAVQACLGPGGGARRTELCTAEDETDRAVETHAGRATLRRVEHGPGGVERRAADAGEADKAVGACGEYAVELASELVERLAVRRAEVWERVSSALLPLRGSCGKCRVEPPLDVLGLWRSERVLLDAAIGATEPAPLVPRELAQPAHPVPLPRIPG